MRISLSVYDTHDCMNFVVSVILIRIIYYKRHKILHGVRIWILSTVTVIFLVHGECSSYRTIEFQFHASRRMAQMDLKVRKIPSSLWTKQ